MSYKIDPKIEALEKKIEAEPDAAHLYDRLLWVYLDNEDLHDHPQRINHILKCVKRFPKERMCRTPFVHIDPNLSPDGFQTVEKEWLKLLAESPGDPMIALGAANFYCTKDLSRSIEILKPIVDTDPSQAEVWLQLGRYTIDPEKRLGHFMEAQRQGSDQPNLSVWIAQSAVEAGETAVAEVYATELLKLSDDARAEYGYKLDWNEKGRDLFDKALEIEGDRSSARKLVDAISAHAYHKHWGHTVLGRVAMLNGDIGSAVAHLKESGSVVGDHRLSSYGPNFSLAKALCEKGEWSHVAIYLQACKAFWKDERLPIWISMVDSRKMPDF